MKLIFKKNEIGEISVKHNTKDFSSQDYIKMIKHINDDEKIQIDYEGDISDQEKTSINLMIFGLNNVKSEINEVNNEAIIPDNDLIEYPEEDIDPEDIPF
jgi:hypothetical protein